MVMTRAQFARDLQDGINAHFGMAYDEHPEEWSEIFETKTSKRAYEEQVMRVGLGEAVEKPEGGIITFDAGAEGWVSRVTFYTYALAFAVTEEAIDDNLYADISELYGKELARALQHAKEVRGAQLLNRAFNPLFVGGDGAALCDPGHKLWGGGTYANSLVTPADLSEESLEDIHIAIGGFVNDRNRPIVVRPKGLLIPRQLEYIADRIFKTNGRVGTDLNDINTMKGKFKPKVNHYFTDPDAFFLQNDVEQGLMYWQRKKVKKGMETDFRTGNMMWKASERYGFSWTDPRCIFGSSGSSL